MKKLRKTPIDKLIAFLSAIFILVLWDTILLHPYGNIAALVLLLMGCYQVGRNIR